MRILVTGGEGFVGSHLVARLLAAGHQVTTLDDGSQPPEPRILGDAPGLTAIRGSILDADLVTTLAREAEMVYHLAAVVGVRKVLEDPLRCMEVNTEGTRNVFMAAAEGGLPVVYASSSEVYGARPEVPFDETQPLSIGSPEVARWSYAVSKLHGEHLGFCLARQRGLPFAAARFFNVVGRGQRRDHGVLPFLVGQALAGEPLKVYAPGSQKRAFLAAQDAAQVLAAMAARRWEGPLVFNLGSGNHVSIRALAEIILAETGSSSEIRLTDPVGDLPSGFAEVPDRLAATQRLSRLVGAFAPRDLPSIVRDVAEGLRNLP